VTIQSYYGGYLTWVNDNEYRLYKNVVLTYIRFHRLLPLVLINSDFHIVRDGRALHGHIEPTPWQREAYPKQYEDGPAMFLPMSGGP